MGVSVHKLFFVATLLAVASASQSFGATYYVDPGGNDGNLGTEGNPFATVNHALSLLNNQGGHTIYLRGGTYNYDTRVTIQSSRTGTSSNPNSLLAYPGETPILDFATMDSELAGDSDGRGVQFNDGADWWVVKGLTIQHARDNGLYNGGSNSHFEQIITRENQDSGFQLHDTAANNLVLNCDSYLNYDPQTVNSMGVPIPGENADGFAVKDPDIGPGNIFRGNRAWANSDDGWDTFDAIGSGVLVQDSWSFDNGFNLWGVSGFAGDGTGYKLGRDGGAHVLTNVLAIDNASNGIDVNGNGTGVQVYNSTSFSNTRNWQFDETSGQTQNQHVLQNNISLGGSQSDNFFSGVTHSFNTWNGISVNSADFESVDRMDGIIDLLKQPRNPDGSLPDLGGFLHLISGSNLIDAGTPINFTFGGVTYNLPYNGDAPDLGAYEFVEDEPILAGDYNDDGKVSAADYTVWRDNLGANITLDNENASPGVVDEEDYDVWLDHYGETNLGSGAGSAASLAAVPEPSAILIAAIVAGLLIASRRVS